MGGILAVRQGERIVKVASTVRGRLPPPWAGHATAEELAREHGGSFALGLLHARARAAGGSLRAWREVSPFHEHVEAFVGGLRELEQAGELELWPSRLAEWPIPTERALESA